MYLFIIGSASSTFYSIAAASTHVVAIVGQLNTEVTINFYPACDVVSPPSTITIPGLILNSGSYLRSA